MRESFSRCIQGGEVSDWVSAERARRANDAPFLCAVEPMIYSTPLLTSRHKLKYQFAVCVTRLSLRFRFLSVIAQTTYTYDKG